MAKPPISAERAAANQANAAKSTGPHSGTPSGTSEGKARASQNARKHSFNPANFAVLRLEDIAEIANRRADLIDCYQPVNSQELWAIERLALAQQALDRCSRAEIGMYTACLNESLDPDGRPLRLMYLEMVEDIDVLREHNRNFLLWEGFSRLMRQSQDVLVFLRIQAQTERLYRRSAEDFERIRKLRKELPNQPNFQTEPEETKPVDPPKTNPPDEPAAAPPDFPPPPPPSAPVDPSRKPPITPVAPSRTSTNSSAPPDAPTPSPAPIHPSRKLPITPAAPSRTSTNSSTPSGVGSPSGPHQKRNLAASRAMRNNDGISDGQMASKGAEPQGEQDKAFPTPPSAPPKPLAPPRIRYNRNSEAVRRSLPGCHLHPGGHSDDVGLGGRSRAHPQRHHP
jgi:hypothetical protein